MKLRSSTKYLIGAIVLAAGWGRLAHAQSPEPSPSPDPTVPQAPVQPPADQPVVHTQAKPDDKPAVTATSPATPDATPAIGEDLSEADRDLLLKLANEHTDVIVVKDLTRARDTTTRLDVGQLQRAGVTDLGQALSLLTDVAVRDAGRGGFNIDIRGARKGAVSVLIDGVLVTDPYYGTFDVSTIPITDIVEIRVATTPQSPIDGPGGPGGVIEVVTRDAMGPRLVVARLTGDSLPTVGMTGTARVDIAKGLAARISASGVMGARDMDLPGNASIGEERHAATGATRFEYKKGNRHAYLDLFLDNRHYIAPPSDVNPSGILLIDGETTERVQLKVDDKIGELTLQGQGWLHNLSRTSRFYSDPTMTNQLSVEDLSATRVGGALLASQPFADDFRWVAAFNFDHESAVVKSGDTSKGDVTLVEPAAELQYATRKFRGDLSAGVAVPIGVGASPWPEAKAIGKVHATKALDVAVTGGYKGRLPSLRERFDAATGNPALGPEKAYHAEVRAIEQVTDQLRVEVAPFYRRTSGTVRVSTDPMDMGKLTNLGELDIYGVDAMAKFKVHPKVEVGGSYDYIFACQLESTEGCDHTVAHMGGGDPLDRLPHHRFDAFVLAAPWKGYSAQARLHYLGKSIDKTELVDGYAIVEATVSAQITKQYLGVLRVDDLLDVRPETRAGFHAPGRVISLVLQGAWE